MKKFFILVVIFFLFTPTISYACGAFLSPSDTNVRPDGLQVMISYDEKEKEEKMLISVGYDVNQGDVEEFGWIMPFPSKPKVEEADEEVFKEARKETEIKETLLEKFEAANNSIANFGYIGTNDGLIEGMLEEEGAYDMQNSLTKSTVSVVDEIEVGIYDMAIIQAKKSKDILDWANENGFVLKWEKTGLIEKYIENDWYFVLAKIKEEEGNATQTTLFTFETEEPIYPIEMMKYDINGEVNEGREIAIRLYMTGNKLYEPNLEMDYLYGGKTSKDWTFSDDKYITEWYQDFRSDQLDEDLTLTGDNHLKRHNDGTMTVGEWFKLAIKTIFIMPVTFILVAPAIFIHTILFVILNIIIYAIVSKIIKKNKTIKKGAKALIYLGVMWTMLILSSILVAI